MLTVGITGGIGSGKTTVCKIFEVLGVPVYYADERAKFLLKHDNSIINQVKHLLGDGAYINGEINRTYISDKVFKDAVLLKKYNDIIHPAVAHDTMKWTQQHLDLHYILKEAALLIETGSYKFLEKLIVVSAPIETRIERVMQRDNVSREAVEARIKNQMPEEEKKKLADFVINNNGSESLINQVFIIHHTLIAESDKVMRIKI
jgi:dephospho-CoA kinase